MKTPKRYQNKPIPTMPEDSEPDWYVINEWCQRAKRKNRIAQLKRSLEKYKDGTHLSVSVAAAYRRLQCAIRPGKHATPTKWAKYLNELRQIQEHITAAITNTAIILAYDAERKAKLGKEQA